MPQVFRQIGSRRFVLHLSDASIRSDADRAELLGLAVGNTPRTKIILAGARALQMTDIALMGRIMVSGNARQT